jgi:hypothetical protein
MARALASASSQYLINGSAVVTAEPFTMACWFQVAALGASEAIMSIGTNGGSHRWQLERNAANAMDIRSTDGSGNGISLGTNGEIAATGTWYHAAGVFAASNSRTGYFNGTAHTTNTTAITVSGVDRTLLGARISTVVGLYLNGQIAEAAVWNAALDAAEVASLSKGFSPLLIRPASLKAYWPLIGRHDPEIDPRGGFNMTPTNGPTAAPHCRVFMPRRQTAA